LFFVCGSFKGERVMKTPKILVEENRIVSVSIPVYFFKLNKEDNIIIAECPSLAISTNGNSLKHAKEMFKDAFNLWRQTINHKGNITEVLKELGWKTVGSTICPKEENHKIPIELLASTSLNLQIPMRNH
jgi:hypothetical protein